MRQGALRAPAQAVKVQDAVLDNADEGAGGADGQDDAEHRVGARAASQVVRHRYQHQQHQLLAVGEADLRIQREPGRGQGQCGVGDQWPEKRGRLQPLAAREVRDQPRQDGDGQQDLRRRDRQLHGRDNADEREEPDLLKAIARGHAGSES